MFFNKHTIKACVICSWWCPRTFLPHTTLHTVSLCICSSGCNARCKADRHGFESKTIEFLGGWKEMRLVFSLMRAIWFAALHANQYFLHKVNWNNAMVLVAKPVLPVTEGDKLLEQFAPDPCIFLGSAIWADFLRLTGELEGSSAGEISWPDEPMGSCSSEVLRWNKAV